MASGPTAPELILPSEWLPVIWGGEEQFALNQRQPPFQLVAASRQQEAEKLPIMSGTLSRKHSRASVSPSSRIRPSEAPILAARVSISI